MQVVVVGGGISGLTSAYYIKKFAEERNLEVEITLLEAKNRVGGKLWSVTEQGYLCETSASGFLDNKPFTLELCDDLGISKNLLKSNDSARRRFIFINGKLRELPSSALGFLFSDILSWRGKLRIALEIFTKPSQEEDETIASFVKRHLGEEALRKLVAPMVSGVFAGDPYKMSLKSAFPVMAQLEKEGNGSLIRAAIKRMRKAKEMKKKIEEAERAGKRVYKPGSATGPGGVLTSFKEGIEYLPRQLHKALGNTVRLNTTCTRVERQGSKYIVAYEGEEGPGALEAEAVVLATPAYVTGEVLSYIDEGFKSLLSKIPYTKLAVVCLGYSRDEIEHPLDGFGFLVPHEEGRTILGCVWDSSMFDYRAPLDKALLRVMVGGARAEENALLKDEELLSRVKEDLKITMGIRAEPEFVRIFRHYRAIPQYLVGHSRILSQLDERLSKYPGLYLTGNSYRGVGINDCVRQAKETAQKTVEYLSNQL